MSTEIRTFIPAKRTPALPVARAHPGEQRPAVTRIEHGVVDEAAEVVRPVGLPARTVGAAVEPEALAGRDDQRDARHSITSHRGQRQLASHLLRPRRRAHLGEEAMRLAEETTPGGLLAREAREGRQLDEDERLMAARTGLLEQGERLP